MNKNNMKTNKICVLSLINIYRDGESTSPITTFQHQSLLPLSPLQFQITWSQSLTHLPHQQQTAYHPRKQGCLIHVWRNFWYGNQPINHISRSRKAYPRQHPWWLQWNHSSIWPNKFRQNSHNARLWYQWQRSKGTYPKNSNIWLK